MSWDAKFFAPIRVPGKRKPLVTLRDAVKYMTSLPREEQNAGRWRPTYNLCREHEAALRTTPAFPLVFIASGFCLNNGHDHYIG
jgi:hypothetical protein